MATVTLTNNFHGTQCTLRVKPGPGGVVALSDAQVRRCRAKLCGSADCKCGENDLKTRGLQPVDIATTSRGFVVLVP